MSRSTSEPCSKRGRDPCQSLRNMSILRSCAARSGYFTNSGPGYELIPLMAFAVPLLGGGFCATAAEQNANVTADAIQKASVKRCIEKSLFPFSLDLFPGFVGMVACKIKKTDLRVFVLVDVAVGRLVVGDVVERHPGRLPPEFVADEGETRAVQRRPDFLDIVMIHNLRTPHGQRRPPR